MKNVSKAVVAAFLKDLDSVILEGARIAGWSQSSRVAESIWDLVDLYDRLRRDLGISKGRLPEPRVKVQAKILDALKKQESKRGPIRTGSRRPSRASTHQGRRAR